MASGELCISYSVNSIDCERPDPHDTVEGFIRNAIIGSAAIRCGDQSLHIPECGLLHLSRSLIRLSTFPVLYGIRASETLLYPDVDFHSTFSDDGLELAVNDNGRRLVFEVPLASTLRQVGTFHASLLQTLFETCPEVKLDGHLRLQIPDAFALAFLLKPEDR